MQTTRVVSEVSALRPSATTAVCLLAAVFVTVGAIGLRAGNAHQAQSSASSPADGSSAPGGIRPPWLQPSDPLEYSGSESCAKCHADQHSAWKTSMHIQMTRPIAEARVIGTFAKGTTLTQNGRSYRFERDGDRYFIWVQHGANPASRFEVHYTLGVNRAQGYLSRLDDGRIYVLPVFWHSGWQRWIDWKEITPVPDTDHDLRQIWNVSCFNCHATHLVKRFALDERRYDTSWSEMGIGCEACHGAGRAHVDLMRAWEQTPALKPASLDMDRSNRGLSATLKIFTARADDRRQIFDTCAYCHGNKTNLFVGFQPGLRYDDFALPFLPSQPPVPDDPQGDFWPDGRPSRFNRPQALMQSGCFEKSDMTCATCHSIHASKYPASLKEPPERHDQLCLQCHATARGTLPLPARTAAERARAVAAPGNADEDYRVSVDLQTDDRRGHTRHAPGSVASQCTSCHMSDVNWRLLMRRRDHTFQAPVPELTAVFGVPNACNECHDDKSPEWAMAAMDRLWGDAPRRARVFDAAEAMYRGQSMDPTVLARLGTLMVDRTQSPVMRASAAEFAARVLAATAPAGAMSKAPQRSAPSGTSTGDMPAGVAGAALLPTSGGAARARQTSYELAQGSAATAPVAAAPLPAAATTPGLAPAIPPTLRNALIAAASDPEATVRAHAVRALSALGDRRAAPALTSRLIDPSRAVRTYAAEALAQLGIVELPGNVGAALKKAQDEYAASLMTFGDNAGDHIALGWFEMERRNDPAAIAALERALKLAPSNPQPRVFLGVIAARSGDYAAAIREWKKVRSAQPGYPNIDRLIEEAERLRSAPGQ